MDDPRRHRGRADRFGHRGGLDVADTDGVDWVEWLIQIGLAALGVAALDRTKARR